MGSEGYHYETDLITENPPPLSKAGLVLLVEIWEASGRAEPDEGGNGPPVEIEKDASYHGNRKLFGAVRGRVISGGYLNFVDFSDNDVPSVALHITELSLSEKAYEALREAGIIGATVESSDSS
jgi:hypothetical protein